MCRSCPYRRSPRTPWRRSLPRAGGPRGPRAPGGGADEDVDERADDEDEDGADEQDEQDEDSRRSLGLTPSPSRSARGPPPPAHGSRRADRPGSPSTAARSSCARARGQIIYLLSKESKVPHVRKSFSFFASLSRVASTLLWMLLLLFFIYLKKKKIVTFYFK